MKILIVEDEYLAAERLAQLIHQYEPHIEILEVLDSVEGTVEYLKKNPKPDLIFLDIHLADGLSFNIFDQVKLNVPVIFVTAYDSYTLQAFKTNSVDYLLKPIDFEELATAMDKFVKVFWQKESSKKFVLDMASLKQALAQPQKSYKKRFVVKRGEHLHPVPVEDILFFYSEDKASLFKTSDNQRFVIDDTLNELEEKLDPEKFFRLNRKYICQYPAIEEILAYSQRRLRIKLKFSDDDEILVSREKVAAFKNWLDQ